MLQFQSVSSISILLYFSTRNYSENLFTYQMITVILTTIACFLLTPVQTSLRHSYVEFPDITQHHYQALVYCPLDQTNTKHRLLKEIQFANFPAESRRNRHRNLQYDEEVPLDIDSYIIVVQWRIKKPTKYGSFYFCSYIRSWEEDCSQARVDCVNPGPIFYVQRGSPIDVAWIHDIDTGNGSTINRNFLKMCCYRLDQPLSATKQYCQNQTLQHLYCDAMVKDQGKEKCTFYEMLNLNASFKHKEPLALNATHIPLNIHVHGLESRPTFDGNPESFFKKKGVKGIGFQSLLNEEYYKQFSGHYPSSLRFEKHQLPFIKVNRYENNQPPGFLWYHDHSVHVTYANVLYGMFGVYIIHDKKIEKDLPSKQFEIFILFSNLLINSYGKMRQNNNIFNNINVEFYSKQSLTFKRNQTYRIRVLNGIYESQVKNIYFLTQCNIREDDWLYNFDHCKRLSFSIMAADNSLFDRPAHNLNSFDIYSGERYEILIVFDGEMHGKPVNSIAEHEQFIWMVTLGYQTMARSDSLVHKRFYLQKKTTYRENQFYFPNQYEQIKGIQFYDLRKITKKCQKGFNQSSETSTMCIRATRFKGLMRDAIPNMAINGRIMEQGIGTPDYVQVGTTQDWYFIGLLLNPQVGHTVHIHLVNSQIIEKGILKKIPGQILDLNIPTYKAQCDYYEIDFYLTSGILKNDTDDYLQLCQRVRALRFHQIDYSNVTKFREDTMDGPDYYGFDVRQQMSGWQLQVKKYHAEECPDSKFKYICEAIVVLPEYTKKWKDSIPLGYRQYVRIRIRFASTQYNPQIKPYPFFNIPEDQLIEFPGYVYHCHLLRHEDLFQMRPLVVTPSKQFSQSYLAPLDSEVQRCMLREKGSSNGWWNRFRCINEAVGCYQLQSY